MIKKFILDEKAEALVEYVLGLCFITLAGIGFYKLFTQAYKNVLDKIIDKLSPLY